MDFNFALDPDQSAAAEADIDRLLFELEETARNRALNEQGTNRSLDELLYHHPEEDYGDLEEYLMGN